MARFMMMLAVAGLAVSGTMAIIGPRNPDPRARCDEEGNKAVDTENMCWYHECTFKSDGVMDWMPRRCALGSKVSYNFVSGMQNPCTINFDSEYGYPCDRTQPSVNGPPPCYDQSVRQECFNGGAAVFEADKCWCDCPPSWQGHFDCSLPTQNVQEFPVGSNICVGGQPMEDWCNMPGGGCLNGDCYNQCDTFWCDCPDHENNDYFGKRCERNPQ